jgi:hydroxymethyl cephem carbamoyltransferase
MNILSLKPGHDGSISFIQDGNLQFSFEGEKDSHTRYTSIHPVTVVDALLYIDEVPDVLAVGGWYKGPWITDPTYLSGYFGCEESCRHERPIEVFGRPGRLFSSTHERSHLLCAYGMSPFEQGQQCYALIWEGQIGAFYQIDEEVRITKLTDVLPGVGDKYLYFYNLAHSKEDIDFSAAGKLMALAAFSKRTRPSEEDQRLIDFVVNDAKLMSTPLDAASWSSLFRKGVENERFKNLAGVFSDQLYDRVLETVKPHVNLRAPLLIAGGCALNCDWNTRWLESNMFTDVFVPPCANDSGSGIGTAIDAQLYFTGSAKVDWTVYAGAPFVNDMSGEPVGFHKTDVSARDIALLLSKKYILGWVQGRYEIGPRALGHRSILAEPFTVETRNRLNEIKRREGYRPFAPVCLEERVHEYFDWQGPSRHMLYFQRVKCNNLKAVTHVDGTVRVQTLRKDDADLLYQVIENFRQITGTAVLCNTSLNAHGRGFINRLSELVRFTLERRLDGFVIEGQLYMPIKKFT